MNRKVLHILDHSLPIQSGYSFRTQKILESQRATQWNPIGLTSLKHNVAANHQPLLKEEFDHISIFRTSSKAGRNSVSPLKVICSLRTALKAIVKQQEPAILHAHSPVLNAIPAILPKRIKNLPVVYEIRAFWEDAAVDLGTTDEGSVRYRLTKLIETWICQKVDHVIVICDGLKQDLIKRGIPASKISLAPNGVDPEAFSSDTKTAQFRERWALGDKIVFGFIGSFYHYEGLELLVKSFKQVLEKRDDCTLVLAGGGPMEKSIKTLIQTYSMHNSVILTGRLPHEDISSLYHALDFCVYPRLSIRLTELVTPLKPLEAMSAGRAILASDIGGHRELISDGVTGLLFPPNNENALTKCLLDACVSRQKLLAIANQAKEWVKSERRWSKTTEIYDTLYQRLLTPKQDAE